MTADGTLAGAIRPAPVADVQAGRLGRRIRRLRLDRGMTLVALAEAAGLSHPFLSQLERGLARPSMGSLERIARALGTSQLELFAGAEEPAVEDADITPSLVRAGEGPTGPYAEGGARLLVRGLRQFQPIEFAGSNAEPDAFYVHDEDEFVYVLEGRVRVELDGEGEWLLEEGDSLYWHSRTPHRWSSPGGKPYRMLVVKDRFGRGEDRP
ncbi:XRE family transcriptional regulator [Naasia sp. SYSU D00057]|uniref:helix-turn-helix domain-containing protein n=1 Tax=Naasia sp. SYSU D00057 TaxID=2817380 RepID=UPI0027DD8D64|nr:XRE family transcriptional regulator [Naasia sp. SYSU D00057]